MVLTRALKGSRVAFIATLVSTLFVLPSTAQSSSIPRTDRIGSSPSRAQRFPSPTNIKVLSRNLTGSQVQTIMNQWSAELGVRCSACHLRDSDGVGPGGPPHPRFAEDSKPMKQVARLMYTMTVEINRKYIVGQDSVPGPVNCGTCHSGSIKPEPFVAPRDAPGALIQPSESAETPAPQSRW